MLRAVFALHPLITGRHLDILGKLLLVLGLLNLYCYATEMAATVFGDDAFETAAMHRRLFGPHAWAFWTIAIAALLPVHLFWFARFRRSPTALFNVGLLVAIGTFADHFMVIVVTLEHDFLPSSAHAYSANVWGIATFAGSVGLFLALMLLATRYLPLVSIVETRRLAQLAQARSR